MVTDYVPDQRDASADIRLEIRNLWIGPELIDAPGHRDVHMLRSIGGIVHVRQDQLGDGVDLVQVGLQVVDVAAQQCQHVVDVLLGLEFGVRVQLQRLIVVVGWPRGSTAAMRIRAFWGANVNTNRNTFAKNEQMQMSKSTSKKCFYYDARHATREFLFLCATREFHKL
jgi:hypothetical protein